MKTNLIFGSTAITVVIAYLLLSTSQPDTPTPSMDLFNNKAIVEISLPYPLSKDALFGERAFEAQCASCHGLNAAGQKGVAPPLVHIIYEPNHHSDKAIKRAVVLGVRAHHWKFGDMPPIASITEDEIAAITIYIRELQRKNGIKRHLKIQHPPTIRLE